MNWNRMVVGLGVAVLVGLLASLFVYRQVRRATSVRAVASSQVVVAASRLPLGALLQPENIRLIPWPAADVLPGVCTQIQNCVNRALITSVVENEPILEAKLAPKGGGAGLPVTITEGMRAVSVQVNDVISVAGFVLPGTTVDVLVTGSAEGRGSITRTILENIRVLAAGQKIEQDKEGKPQTVPVITLLVSPEDANKLTMASTQGKIQLALRNTLDTKKVEPPPVFQASLFGGTPPAPQNRTPVVRRTNPVPERVPFAVEVIRGGKREVSTFTNP